MTVVLGHPARALEAFFEVVAGRERGRHVTLGLRGCDARAALALFAVPQILAAFSDYDDRRVAFDALAAQSLTIDGQPMQRLSALDPRVVRTLRDAARCADRVAVASWTQWERIAPLLDLRIEKAAIVAHVAEIPNPPAQRRDAVVVYAPNESEALVALLVFALQELRAPILVIGDLSLCAGMRAEEASIDALGRARAIVVGAIDDPADARGLARIDAALIVAATSGAEGYLSGIFRFDPWDRLSLLAAVQAGLGADRPRLTGEPPSMPTPPEEPKRDGDLVTIAIRTYNRRELFARALASVAAQTYRTLEIVIVNDGDDDVDDLVAAYPHARIVGNADHLGAVPSLNVALRAARGRWFGWLDDDDRLFPDHVARLVDVLQRSGACAAHADTLSEYFEITPDGTAKTYGFAVNLEGDVDRDLIHIADGVGPMAALVDRDVLLASGGFDETLGFAEDWDVWIRLGQTHDIAHLRAVTAAYGIRSDGKNLMQSGGSAMLEAMRTMIARDELRDRPLLAAARRDVFAAMKAAGGRADFPEPALRSTQ